MPCAAAITAGSSQLPRCAAKHSAGLPSSCRSRKSWRIVGDDAAGVRVGHVVVPQAAEMHVFAGDAAQVVPGAAQGRGDPVGVLVGKRGAQVGATDAMRGQQRTQPRAPSRRTSRRRGRGRCAAATPAGTSPGGRAAGRRRAGGGGTRRHPARVGEHTALPLPRSGGRSGRGCHSRSDLDKDLPEHVAAFQPRETGTELLQRIHRVDHRPHAGCDAVQRAAEARSAASRTSR